MIIKYCYERLAVLHSNGRSHSKYLFCVPTEEWPRLRRPGCLVLCRGGLPVIKWSPITHYLPGPTHPIMHQARPGQEPVELTFSGNSVENI